MKKLLLLLLVVILLYPCSVLAESEPITIVNVDKVNIRNEQGQSLGRVGCYTPVTVGETKDDSTYVTVSRAYLELSQDNYELNEFINKYSGDISGWVKTRCLSEVNEDMDQVIRKAEEYRWEFWVDGIYHELRANGISKNKCYETHNVPTVNGIPLDVHVRPYDVSRKGSAYSASEGWREAYYSFIFDEGFRSFGYNYHDGHDFLANLYHIHDFTSDGIPELIMNTSCIIDSYKYAIFTYKAEEGVTYLCDIPFQYGSFDDLKDERYPGLFLNIVHGGVHVVSYIYYNKNTQKIEFEGIWDNYDDQMPHAGSNRHTEDDNLYQAWLSSRTQTLPFIRRDDILKPNEWNAFLEKCGY